MKQMRKFSNAGGWLPHDHEHIYNWVLNLKARVTENPQPLVPPIQEFKDMVKDDPLLNLVAEAMFKEAIILQHHQDTPLEEPAVKDFNEFLMLLNHIMSQAPEYTECPDSNGAEDPCGLIGFPINALLNWPMATKSGYEFFSNQLVNQHFKKILYYWSEYLNTEASLEVLNSDYNPNRGDGPKVLGWLSETAKQEMVKVACKYDPTYPKWCDKKSEEISNCNDPNCCDKKTFEDIFECDPSDEKHYGFKSWDDFFTRRFKEEVRPVVEPDNDNVIANACESAPLQVVNDVSETSEFWLKGQPYSLQDMMNCDPLAEQFIGGTVYQAFLSALSYHRWHSPVSGTVKKAFVVDGSYYLENRYQHDDDSAPNDSQPFLTAVATRALIFIDAGDPIGLMCFIAVGMAEVSSCEITVVEGQHLNKGDELGMFHFGGSTHCLVFGPQVNIEFDFHNNTSPGLHHTTNIPVCSQIATINTIKKSLIGLKVRSGDIIDGLTPIYSTVTSSLKLEDEWEDSPIGGDGGEEILILPPEDKKDYVVTRIEIQRGNYFGADHVIHIKVTWNSLTSIRDGRHDTEIHSEELGTGEYADIQEKPKVFGTKNAFISHIDASTSYHTSGETFITDILPRFSFLNSEDS